MKNLLLLSFLFVCSSIYSQSITEEGNTWHISQFDVWNGHTRTEIYSIQGDSVVNNLLYKKLYYVNDTVPQTQAVLRGFMRQDQDTAKKVYFFNGIEESIIYDFNAGVNDTLYFDSSQPIWVKSIDSVQLFNGEWRKRWQYTCDLINPNSDVYFSDVVEGIGSTSGHLLTYNHACYPDYDYFFRCFSSNLDVLYNSGNIEGIECYFYFVDVKEVEHEFSIQPNPATNFISISAEGIAIQLKTIDIYTLNGQMLKSEKIDSSNAQMDISELSKGLYFLKMTTESGKIYSSRFVKN